ncbi:hypothetical protein CDD82_1289 [Ophiocordyceps australis]|uniref:Uncharacterized protein n=1 Tax=Ophiocordyceps australis TaxID=1399860 RepID=A0A2C5ZMB2_9HYPO|nr:hypothetical protein CDD82_1289 [Ophiocordyceps australis]
MAPGPVLLASGSGVCLGLVGVASGKQRRRQKQSRRAICGHDASTASTRAEKEPRGGQRGTPRRGMAETSGRDNAAASTQRTTYPYLSIFVHVGLLLLREGAQGKRQTDTGACRRRQEQVSSMGRMGEENKHSTRLSTNKTVAVDKAPARSVGTGQSLKAQGERGRGRGEGKQEKWQDRASPRRCCD